MKILIIGGFLGSGKTTLILRLAKDFVMKKGFKVAIVENEIGDIGVDDKVMNKYGLLVKELFGGCICCQIGAGLVTTLATLKKSFNPDIVIVEPTGVAEPKRIVNDVLRYSKLSIKILPITVLIDPLRFEMLIEVLTRLITSQVISADIIAINKIDNCERDKLRFVENWVQGLNRKATILRISARADKNVGKLEEQLLGEINSGRKSASTNIKG